MQLVDLHILRTMLSKIPTPLSRYLSLFGLPLLAILISHGLQGYATWDSCSSCHGDFRANGGLHDLHTKNPDPVTTNCDLCHSGSGRSNPIIMYSDGDSNDGLGCTGCHGRDYGETIASNYNGLSTSGKVKNSGVGLRLHHSVNGITSCTPCHSGDPTPYPENVIDPGLGNTTHYYLRGDVSLGGSPVDPSSNEDSANDTDSVGQDNDGDDVYDMADSDSVATPSQVTIEQLASGGLRLSWPTPSPDWILQTGSTLSGWSDMTAPAAADRENGYWIIEVDPPLDPKSFYRGSKPVAAAAASSVVTSSTKRSVPKKGKKQLR